MKLSARNQLQGTIVEVRKGQTTAHVRIDIGHGVTVTKTLVSGSVRTLVQANGFNVLCSATTTSPTALQRSVELQY